MAATAAGYDPATGTVPDEGDLTIALRPNVVSGTVSDRRGEPIAGARVFVDGQTTGCARTSAALRASRRAGAGHADLQDAPATGWA